MPRQVTEDDIIKAVDRAKQALETSFSPYADYPLHYDDQCRDLLSRQVLDFIEVRFYR